jgi:hypothetical protein
VQFVVKSDNQILLEQFLNVGVVVSRTVKFRVIEVKGRRAYGSIRDVAREERQAKEAAFWATVEEGKQ